MMEMLGVYEPPSENVNRIGVLGLKLPVTVITAPGDPLVADRRIPWTVRDRVADFEGSATLVAMI